MLLFARIISILVFVKLNKSQLVYENEKSGFFTKGLCECGILNHRGLGKEKDFNVTYFHNDFHDDLKIIHPWDRLKDKRKRKQHDYIIGGEESPRNLYPWAVFLLIYKNGGGFACGGTLITRRHILSASHCIYDKKGRVVRPGNVKAYLGDHDVKDSQRFIIPVHKILPHHRYNRRKNDHFDAAIITLVRPVTFSRNISPICLPPKPSKSYRGRKAIATGWGKNEQTQNEGFAGILRRVAIKVVGNGQCHGWENLFRGQLCAGVGGKKDVCVGDSGGGLVTKEISGRYVIIGIVSYGEECFNPEINKPGVYTRVSFLRRWIKHLAPESMDSNCLMA